MAAENELDLEISRLLKAPRSLVWKAWTDPVHLKEWWCPKPWTTEVVAFDLSPGGAFHTLMRGPDGGISDNPGTFLEIVPESRLVWTTGLVAQWRPAHEPWLAITAYITMQDEAGGTRYVARVLHKDKKSRDEHEKMGFFDGWGTCIAQLDDYALALK
jgi:uncharacterized protein YndB with AHSA1/START domain